MRGSTGYGLKNTQQVDQDWGGKDRLDHVTAMQRLARDSRLDTSRAAVVGCSYGGQYLMFENEGHDVLKHENRIRCYTDITEFFRKYLNP